MLKTRHYGHQEEERHVEVQPEAIRAHTPDVGRSGHCRHVRRCDGAQITGTPGTPGTTTTIDGRYLPPPPQQFGGEISTNADQSKPYWPALVVPPKGAPNVLLIMTDDVGFSAPSTFGGVIPTPALDRIASMGLRYTRFHTRRSARRRGLRSSPGAITTRWPPPLSSTRRPATPATTASFRATPSPSARSCG